MSNGEVDYNQIESGLSHAGWVNPTGEALDLAFGGDTRFVVSAGPFDLPPGDSIIFSVAFTAGQDVLSNPFISTWFEPGDPLSVSDYYELMNMTNLDKSALAAVAAYRSGYRLPPPGPPERFTIAGYDDNFVEFRWSQKFGADLAGYRLSQKSDMDQWTAVAEFNPSDTGTVIADLIPNREYRFALASFDSAGSLGMMTPEIVVQLNRPHPPDALVGTAQNAYPELCWRRALDADITQYRVYRQEIDAPGPIVVGETSDTIFIDFTAAPAHTYDYFVTSLSPALNPSQHPGSADAAYAQLRDLAYNANDGVSSSNLIFRKYFFDSLVAQALGGIKYACHDIDSLGPLSLAKLSQYSLLIVSSGKQVGRTES